jgi:cob(I)alamin adenosyltransferase
MSIATKQGDRGQTGLAGGVRVSKSDPRVEAYGTLDELIAALGLARSICDDREVSQLARQIQRELFAVGSALATPPGGRTTPPPIPGEMVEALTREVHRLEATGLLADWALPGEHPGSSAFDLARTICRRAERQVVRLSESGTEVSPVILAYLNRLSDLLWLLSRFLEKQAGVDAALRDAQDPGRQWSRAW